MIPGELTIGAQTGPLTGPLDLRNVHYKNATMDLRLGHLHLAWKAGRLRQRMLDARLAARRYTREHGEDDPEISGWTWDADNRSNSLSQETLSDDGGNRR